MQKETYIQIRISNSEKAELQKEAREQGMSLSLYLLEKAKGNQQKEEGLKKDLVSFLCRLNILSESISDVEAKKELQERSIDLWQRL